MKSRIKIYKNYIMCHLLRSFFESKDTFEQELKLLGIDYTMDAQLYSDLFWFTNKKIYIPLWASAIKSGVDVLLNHITYDVIKAYKNAGYSPVLIDGNPADYIGEQFRFMEYLYGSGMKHPEDSNDRMHIEQLAQDFRNMFLNDTVHAVASSLMSVADSEELMKEIREQNGIVFCDADESELKASILFLISMLDCIPGETFDAAGLSELTESELVHICKELGCEQWSFGEKIEVEQPQIVFSASNCDCGGKCRTLVTAAEGCILDVEPDRNGTEIEFHGCPRGRAYPETYLTSRRLRYPMVRIGERGDGRFRRVSWDYVTSELAEKIVDVRKKHGPGGRYVSSASGVCAAIRGDGLMRNLLALDGGFLDYYNFYSAACGTYINPYIYGDILASNTEECLEYSSLIILWGHNPAENHFNTKTKGILARAKEKGARIIVIDPRFSDTAITLADQWIPIRPSSDNALIDAMAYVIWENNLEDKYFMDKYCIGFDEEHMPEGIPENQSYKAFIYGLKDGIVKTPEWAESITGIPAKVITELAIEYATAKPAALIPGFSVQRTMVGEQVVRGFAALACMTGNPGKMGGSTGSTYLRRGYGSPYMEMKANPYPGMIPSFYWSRAIDRPESIDPIHRGLIGREKLETGIKLLFCLGSSLTLNQHSNINETAAILKKKDGLECFVVSDLFMTPSVTFADIALPAVSFFEIDNMPTPWGANDFILYNHASTRPVFEGQFEYFWIRDVAAKMGYTEAWSEGKETYEDWLYNIYESYRKIEEGLPEYEDFKKSGIFIRNIKTDPLCFREQFEKGKPFNTPSGKIEIFSKTLYELGKQKGREDAIPGTPGYTFCIEGPLDERRKVYPLQLFAYHTKRRCHSQHDQNALLKELDPIAVWIHPHDAESRKIKDGDLVEVFNDRGRMHIPAKVTDRIMPGCIAVSEGGWYTPDNEGIDYGGSINVLTGTEYATPIANANPQHTNLADVKKIEMSSM